MKYLIYYLKRFLQKIFSIVFVVQFFLGTFFVTPVFAAAAPTNIISYQGRLLNSNRVPLSSSSASILFELYTASSGGTCVWSNSSASCASATARTVTLTDGLFSENLGDTAAATPYAAIGDAIFGDNSALYLQITVNGETLTPRKYISAAPYALNTQLLDGLDSDSDGSTAAAIVALNSSGNLTVTGNPGGSGVSQGSVYINPASASVSANDTLLGIALEGTSVFRVDAEGDTVLAGDLTLADALSSTGTTFDFLDDASSATTIHIGGVTTDLGNTISVATDSTTADIISIGNTNVSTTLTVASGTWDVTSTGDATFHDIGCTDCLGWFEFADTSILDAATAITFGSYSLTLNTSGSGSFLTTNAQGDVLSMSPSGAYNYRLNSTQNPSYVISNEGTSDVSINLASTGDFVLKDLGSAFVTFSDTGAYTYTLDASDNPSYLITNSGSSNVITNLAGTGDFVIQDNGTAFATFSDSGAVDIAAAATTTSAFTITANSLTSGNGFKVLRSDSVATDFTGSLVDIEQNRTSAGSTGTALAVSNFGGGNSSAVYIIQDQVADATTTPSAQALVIDVNEAASNDEVIIIRSDADNSSGLLDTEFRFENDGDFFGDGASYNTGADYAEFFPTTDSSLDDFDVVCWNGSQANGVKRCAAGETNVVGVISVNPAFVGNNFVGAGSTLEGRSGYAMVGLVGQLDTHVSAEAGAIRIGDAITTSASLPGYGEKASGGTYIIGRALEPLSSGTGLIKVLVQPMWYGGDMLSLDGDVQTFQSNVALQGSSATASVAEVDSAGLSFIGSRWDGSSAERVTLMLRNAVLPGGSSRLALSRDDGQDVMTFGSTGDLAIAGNLYPSDRGVLQYGAYVYYDSTGAGFMKTNASGWAAPSSGYSESFTSADALVAGDVVEFVNGTSVARSSGEAYSDHVVGVVSPASGFVAGSGAYAVVISGRANIKVTAENGAIAPGDALTTSSRPGYAMKATQAGEVVGFALTSHASGEGSVQAFIRPQYFAGGSEATPLPSSSIAINSQDIDNLNVSGLLSMNGGDIISVGALSGIGTWEIQESGDFVTQGQLVQVVSSLQNTRVSTYAMTSTEATIQLSGTATLHNGLARVTFEHEDPNFNDILSPEDSYRVLVTPNGITGQLYVTDRSNSGFIIRDAAAGEGVAVDWLVLAYRYDLVPERARTSNDANSEEVAEDSSQQNTDQEDESQQSEDLSDIEGEQDLNSSSPDSSLSENEEQGVGDPLVQDTDTLPSEEVESDITEEDVGNDNNTPDDISIIPDEPLAEGALEGSL